MMEIEPFYVCVCVFKSPRFFSRLLPFKRTSTDCSLELDRPFPFSFDTSYIPRLPMVSPLLLLLAPLLLSTCASFSSSTCEDVRQSYQDVGCCDSAPRRYPGWAGKICTSIIRTNYTTSAFDTFVYAMLTMRFDSRGSRVNVTFFPPTAGRDKEFYLALRRRLSGSVLDGVVIFNNYLVDRTYNDPHFLSSSPQTAPDQSWVGARGYQLNGMRFSADFRRARLVNSADIYLDHATRLFIADFFPLGFFGTYGGGSWLKDAYYLDVNGDVDEDETEEKYFVCEDS